MTVADVTARIGQIQAQLALLAPAPAATGSAGFADALRRTTTTPSVATGGPAPSDHPSGATESSSALGLAAVAQARQYVGLPYVWGGTDPTKGLDCSGLVQVTYRALGIELPRVSADQARAGFPVASMADARPGDLIAWDNSGRNVGADHIAIYIGHGKMIEAPRTGLDVRIVDVPSTPDYIRRVVPEGPANPVSGSAMPPVAAASSRAGGVPFAPLFEAASARHGVSATLLSAVARQESGFDPTAVSPAGAQGLMQLMPATARGLGVTDSFDPAQAVDGAARLLRDLLDRFGSAPLALAAYNAGPGAVLRYDGIPPYPETQRYVRSVMSAWQGA